ncbi:hypothetical protein KC367_g111 [Hortaea werneckii]|nr:hypothetical protein KC367_g111 [Hortaea werneckii]
MADGGRDIATPSEGQAGVLPRLAPCRRIGIIGGVLERARDLAARDRRRRVAVGVINQYLLYFRARPQQQASDRREDDSDGEEERQHGFRSQDRLPCLQSLLSKCRIYAPLISIPP